MRRLLLAAVAVALLSGAGIARADGDPASDTLLYANVYLPYAAPPKSAASALQQAIASVYSDGNRVKVAVIQSRDDLGAIPSLFGKPANYATFLGHEISGVYIGPLLIVMPQGYGVYDGGRSVAAEQRVLGGLGAPGTTSGDLVSYVTNAVTTLEHAQALRSKDILPPYVQPLQTRVRNGKLTVLFYLYDDSGKAATTVTELRGTSIVATSKLAMQATSVLHPVSATISLPSGSTKVCLSAVDPSGNVAKKACKKL